MSPRKVICYRCLGLWTIGSGLMIKHPKLKDKVEVCPHCKCWWFIG